MSTENHSSVAHKGRCSHSLIQSTARSKVDQHTSSDLDLVGRCIDQSSLDHDVVGLDVSMSQSMTIKVCVGDLIQLEK